MTISIDFMRLFGNMQYYISINCNVNHVLLVSTNSRKCYNPL
ncbi:hypothetical protein XO29_0036 [Bacillus phage phiS58]|uniref:Uncharacterized protein n=1 Tax=Bacillus phage phiS58 TaxID=1643327 RepID=A0A0S2MVJ8_9CAUD|nr:hypothetical protein XO29_0036 [Bacillus phage phiS58]